MLGYTTNFEVHIHIEVAIGVDTIYLILIYDRLFSSVGNYIIEEAAVYYLETRIYRAAPREEITTLHIYLSKVPTTSRPPTPTPTPKLPISHPQHLETSLSHHTNVPKRRVECNTRNNAYFTRSLQYRGRLGR